MRIPSLDDLFDFSRLRKPEPAEEPPSLPPRRRVVRDREALRSVLGGAALVPIDVDAEVLAARMMVRTRTLQALDSLRVEPVQPSVAPVAEAPSEPRWRLLVRTADQRLEFYVPGLDVVDAVTRGTARVADWMRTNHAGAPWRVHAVEDLSSVLL